MGYVQEVVRQRDQKQARMKVVDRSLQTAIVKDRWSLQRRLHKGLGYVNRFDG